MTAAIDNGAPGIGDRGADAESSGADVQVYEGIEAIPEEVRDELRTESHGAFFGSLEWFSCLSEYGSQGRRDLILLLAGLPPTQPATRSFLYLTRELGSGRYESLSSFYTIRYPVNWGPADPEDGATAKIVDRLCAGDSECRSISIDHLARTDAELLAREFARHGWCVDVRDYVVNWRTTLDGRGFEEYWSSRPGWLRSTVERKRRKALNHIGFRIDLVAGTRELKRGLADFQEVYRDSWKTPERAKLFVPRLIERCARLGILRLGIAYDGAVPVAAQLWILNGKSAVMYKIAHKPEVESRSIGSILTAYMIETAIRDDSVEEIDFGTGDEAYKKDWMEQRRQLLSLAAYRPGTFGAARATARLIVRRFLSALKIRSSD